MNLLQPIHIRGLVPDVCKIKILTICQVFVPIFLLLNVVLTANNWDIGRVFYLLALLLCGYCTFKSKLLFPVLFIICLIFIFRVGEIIQPNLAFLRTILTSVIFLIFGIILYSSNTIIIKKVFVWTVCLSVPVMFFQIIGLHESLFYWGNDGLHDIDLMSIEEIGSFKSLPLYPTYLTPISDLTYSIVQGRPSGLMANNNTLSVITAFAFILNLYVRPRGNHYFIDIIVCLAVVLLMSKYVFVVVFLTIYFAGFGEDARARRVAIKCSFYLVSWIIVYGLIFPGLLAANLSTATVIVSFWGRFIDIFKAIGIDSSLMLSSEVIQTYALDLDGNGYGDSHPLIKLLSSGYLLLGLSLSLVLAYLFGLKKSIAILKASNLHSYYLRRMLLVATVLAIPVMPNFVTMNIYLLACGVIFTPFREKISNENFIHNH